MNSGQSPRLASRAADAKGPHANGHEAGGKKQATPSQKRLQKQQRQQQHQQSRQNRDSTQAGCQPAPAAEPDVANSSDQNERCNLKISSQLEEFARKASEIKSDIGVALERQQGRAEGEQAVLANVEQLRSRLGELTVGLTDDTAGVQTESITSGQCPAAAQPSDELATAKVDNKEPEGPTELERPAERPESGQAAACKLPGREAATADSGESGCFEPLAARLDQKSKFVALRASLEKQFGGAPELLEPVCNKLLAMSHQLDQLKLQNEAYQAEVSKLRLIKERLSELCRELQRSNNQIRIESLGLIKSEQHKAKEQADKIQTTLAGVMKLFDENQQRNVSLRQENADLQAKLRQLLEHCENWERCVETALKQRELANRLTKTELARLAVARNEEQERGLREKQDLLRALETMRSHQSRVEDKEAQLRSDLSSYATKYDQCQELIQDGLGKFQAESKRMLKQIERSRQDYVLLLNKYEASNKKIKQLLEEKRVWVKTAGQAAKKQEALEKLCRSLKADNDRLAREAAGAPEAAATCRAAAPEA